MYCPQCGRENGDSAPYCAFCGTSLTAETAVDGTTEEQAAMASQPGVQPESEAPTPYPPTPPAYEAPAGSGPYGAASFGDVAQEAYQQSAQMPPQPGYAPNAQVPPQGAYQPNPEMPPQGAYQPGPQAQQAPYQPGSPTPPMSPYPPSAVQEGCFSAAWRDLTSSPGWFKRTILLGLLDAVPILNLSVEGYAMDWGRELAYERREAMPEHFFGHKTMLLGLCLTVFSVLMGIFMATCSVVVSAVVPILGFIAAIVFCVFASMFTYTGLIRMGIFGKFGAAFDLVADWRAFRRNLGTLFCASFLPSIVIGLIAGAIVSIILAIVFSIAGMNAYDMIGVYGYGYGYSATIDPRVLVGSLGGMTFVIVLILLLCWFILAIANTLIKLVTYRALGHWALRTVPEWRAEAFEEQKIYGVDFPAGPMLEEIRRDL